MTDQGRGQDGMADQREIEMWREAALMKDRTRRAIRERRQVGEPIESLAADYGVPVAFVDHLCSWQLFGDAPDGIETSQTVACPNCGCAYETAKELRAWKDNPCHDVGSCNPFVSKCGAKFCTMEELNHHERLCHPASVSPEQP